MRRHRATVRWDGFYWVGSPDTGGVTQAKRLDLIRPRLSEVARLMTGETVAAEHWDLQIGDEA